MNFKLSTTQSESKWFPPIFLLCKGVGDILETDFVYLFRSGNGLSAMGINNSIQAYNEAGYIETPSPSGEGTALIGAYDVNPANLSLRRNNVFMAPDAWNRTNSGDRILWQQDGVLS